ncbi:MAG: pyridoxal 5'-phosphate synthase [Thermoleophilia bacterium]|nr:pyridoxal 5'-phosphate synthase [Thermoleophilia bacterium]
MAPLLPEHLLPDPARAMCAWIDEARATRQPQAMAMTLATSGTDGHPSARMVFVRGWDPGGLEWITDGASRKARELAAQPHAAGVFLWAGLGRQLRVEGPVHLLHPERVQEHMARRRPATRAAARAWRQGERLESRADLHRRLAQARVDDDAGGVPPGWLGHRLQPHVLEFWQEDPDGLHDRLRATRQGDHWHMERLAP